MLAGGEPGGEQQQLTLTQSLDYRGLSPLLFHQMLPKALEGREGHRHPLFFRGGNRDSEKFSGLLGLSGAWSLNWGEAL